MKYEDGDITAFILGFFTVVIILWLTVITFIVIKSRNREHFVTEPQKQEITVRVIKESENTEPGDDEIVISVGHGENERIIYPSQESEVGE